MKRMKEETLTREIIGALIEVHRYWGPGLYEEIYQRSVAEELRIRGIPHVEQLALPLLYKGHRVGDDLRLDVWVAERAVVEIKAVRELLPVHDSQTLTYMRLTKSPVGLLVNFNVAVVRDGLRRFVL